jgi:hypothetical protein
MSDESSMFDASQYAGLFDNSDDTPEWLQQLQNGAAPGSTLGNIPTTGLPSGAWSGDSGAIYDSNGNILYDPSGNAASNTPGAPGGGSGQHYSPDSSGPEGSNFEEWFQKLLSKIDPNQVVKLGVGAYVNHQSKDNQKLAEKYANNAAHLNDPFLGQYEYYQPLLRKYVDSAFAGTNPIYNAITGLANLASSMPSSRKG